MSKYEQSKFREGFRVGVAAGGGQIVSISCPYGVGDGNVSLAERAWKIGLASGMETWTTENANGGNKSN